MTRHNHGSVATRHKCRFQFVNARLSLQGFQSRTPDASGECGARLSSTTNCWRTEEDSPCQGARWTWLAFDGGGKRRALQTFTQFGRAVAGEF